MHLTWTKKQKVNTSPDGVASDSNTMPASTSSHATKNSKPSNSLTLGHLFTSSNKGGGGEGKRIHTTEVQVIPYPILPASSPISSSSPMSSPVSGNGMLALALSQSTESNNSPTNITHENNAHNIINQQEDANEWEVEIVPVPTKPKPNSRSFGLPSIRRGNNNNRNSPSSQVDQRKISTTTEPSPEDTTTKMAAATDDGITQLSNQLYDCAMMADGFLTAASDTVMDILVKTITVADDVISKTTATTTTTSTSDANIAKSTSTSHPVEVAAV